MNVQSGVRPPRVIHERALVFVFLAFLMGFVLPLAGCLGASAVLLAGLAGLSRSGTPALPRATAPAVAVIYVRGTIASQESSSSAVVTPEEIGDLLDQAAQDPNVRAVVLRVESPGGSVVASNEIYRALLAFDKPIVVSMGDLAASGGYYISCAAQHIVANPDTLTGSIGVISEFPNVAGLLEKVGVEVIVIASGPSKDLGSPYREMTAEERALWAGIIQEVYDGFVQVVAEGRDLPVEQVRELADGRVYTGRQALEVGLVDELGTLDDAVARAAELGGIAGTPQVIELTPPQTLYELLMGFQSRGSLPSPEEWLNWGSAPSLEYRYVGP
jgi:protease-4